MKKMSVVLFSLFTFVMTAFAGPYDAWSKYRTVTINTTADDGGANVANSLTDMPVLVRLSDADAAAGADVLAEALAGGADIRFADATGNLSLPFDIQYWSSSRAAIWVRVPVVNGNANTTIRMFWGNDFVTSASNPGAVFKTDNGYMAAWHLGNASGSAARPNAVTGGNPATPGGSETASMNPVPGIIGMADTLRSQDGLNNTTRDHFSIGGGYADFTTGLTISVWAYPISVENWQKFIEIGNGAPDKNIGLGRREGSQDLIFEYYPGPAGEWSGQSTTAANAITQNTWQHLAATMGPDNIRRVYKNGELIAGPSAAGPALPVVTRNFGWIGRTNFNDRQYRGKMEAMRIANVARSDDWLKFEYETQRAGATAVTLGSSEEQTATFAYPHLASVYVVDQPITNIPTVNGDVHSITVSPALPAGLMLDPMTGSISGAPTDVATEGVYTVTAVLSNPDETVTTDLTITVNPRAPTQLAYPVMNVMYGIDTEIDENIPTVNSLTDPNQMVTNFSITPALPAGLTIDAVTGVISGTPTEASSAKTYTVTASNVTGSTTAQLTIAVTPPPSALTYKANPVVYTGGLAAPIVPNTPSVTGLVTNWSITPALPAGMIFDTATGAITGTPMAGAAGPFTVSATNVAGSATVELDLSVSAVENYSGWSGMAEFTLSTATATVAETQEQFPLLVRLTAAHAQIFDGAKEDGSDIRFSKHDGTRLAYEVDHYDSENKSAAFWVLVDEVEGNSTLDLHVHWGKADAAVVANGSRVFNTTNGFLSVFHMGGDRTTPRPNAVGDRNPATPKNLPEAYADRAGVIGRADTLMAGGSALTAQHFSFGPVTAKDLPTSHLTISMWLGTPSSMPGPTHAITLAGPGSSGKQNNVYVARRWSNNVDFNAVAAGNGGEDGVGACCWISGNWQLIHAVLDGSVRRVYQNGVLIGQSGPSSQIGILDRQHALIGATLWGDGGFPGSYDEVRLANVVRSAGWSRLEYQTQAKGIAPLADLSYSQPSYSFVEESPITPITVSGLFGVAANYSISPALPPSLNFNTSTGEITGTPDDGLENQTFTVTARNGVWSASTTFDLEITSMPPGNIVYAANPVTYQAGLVAAGNVPTNNGTITSWSISPALPDGLHFNTLTGVISGEPLVTAAAADYEVIGTGPEGSDTVAVTITVLAPSEDFSTWSHNQSITLNTSATGSDVASTVTNFPVLIRLGHAEMPIFAEALSGGSDIRFVKANGITRLPYEIVSWDTDAKTAEIWVKVDTVYGNNSTQSIKMLWGKAGVSDSSNSAEVFGTSNGFAAVWHMGADSGDELDATANNFTATHTGDPGYVKGMAGGARAFNGTSQYFQVVGSANSVLSFPVNGNYTISTWVLYAPAESGNDNRTIVSKHDNEYALSLNGSGATNWQYFQYANGWQTISSPRQTNVWTHLAVVKDGAASRLYVNGVQTANTTTGSDPNGRNLGTDVFIGRRGDQNNRHWSGYLDELRMATASRSADWLKLDHASQKQYQTLTNIGLQAPTVVYTPDSLTYLQNATITPVSPAVASGPVTDWAVTPALPSGLTLNATTGVITGAPLAVHASTKHTITATNDGGSTSDSIVITVNPGPPADLSYAATPVTYYTGVAIDTNHATVTGEVDSFTVSPALPDGLSLDESTGAITGAPVAVTAQAVYTVTAHNATGTATATVNITVLIPVPAAPVIASPANDALAVPVPFTLLWNTVAGTVDSYQLQGSESGFATVDMDTVITDTSFFIHEAPYASLLSARVRAINSTGPGEWSPVVSFTTIDAPPAISYATTPVIYTVGLEMTPNAPDTTGSGPITGYTIDPDLTAATGLTFNITTGVITGIPTQDADPANYTIVASGPGGKDTVVVNIGTSSEPPPMIAYATDTLVFVKDAAIMSVTVSIDSVLGGPIDSFTVAPAFPAGLSLDGGTGEITGTPTAVVATASYVVTAHGLGGVGRDTLVITVNDIAPVIAYTVDTVTYAVGTAISTLVPSSTGGAVISWSITPDLAGLTGLTFNTTTGELSGTPVNEEPAGNYTIVATNSGGTDTAVIHVTVQGAPLVTKAPADTTVVTGAAASFSVAATASGDLSYQWRKGTTVLANGGNIAGATSDTLKLSAVALADTGAYNVIVTSTLDGTVTQTTSTDGLLRVNTIPVIATQARDTTVVSGGNASFKVTAATGPGSSAGTLSYQWRKGTTNLTNGGKISGATSATLTITGAALADTASTYNVVVTRTLNGTTMNANSGNATLRVNVAPVISGQPANRTVVAGASAGFKVTATVAGGGTLSYQWRKGTTNLTNGANVSGATSDTLTVSGTALADTGAYNVVVTSTLNGATAPTTSDNATLSVNVAPVISGQPAARTVVAGTSAGFKVVAPAGAGSSAGTLSYQWRKGTTNLTNGANVTGATSDTLTLTNVAVSDTSANYNVVVTRTLNGTVTTVTSSNTALRVNAAPVISGQPAARTGIATASAGFKVAATVAGGGTLSYQWRKGTANLVNGANVSGATSDTLTLSNLALADTATNYNVVVTSTLNGVTTTTTSGNATLLVNAAPTITTQPVATAHIVAGTNLSLTVAVAGGPGTSAGTLSYQWRKGATNLTNAGNISGATSANLVITTPVAADTGTYSVVVTRTLNGTTTTVTSTNSEVQLPVSIVPGSFVFRVSGELKQYTFQLPAGAVTTEKVTMSINDVSGRTLWTYSIYPSRDPKARDIVWNGATSTGRPAAAGMYIVKLSVRNSDQTTTRYIQKSVSLKPSR